MKDTQYALTADPNKPLREAREEIERLREQLRLANIDNFNTTAEVERLRAERDKARQKRDEARKERDDADPLLEELWHRRTEAFEMRSKIERLRAECDRLASRNTMLVNELSERGRVFSPEQLKRAIVKALYEGEG